MLVHTKYGWRARGVDAIVAQRAVNCRLDLAWRPHRRSGTCPSPVVEHASRGQALARRCDDDATLTTLSFRFLARSPRVSRAGATRLTRIVSSVAAPMTRRC